MLPHYIAPRPVYRGLHLRLVMVFNGYCKSRSIRVVCLLHKCPKHIFKLFTISVHTNRLAFNLAAHLMACWLAELWVG